MSDLQTDTVILRCKTCDAMNRVPVKRLSQNPLCGKCRVLLDFPFKPIPVTSANFEQETASWPEALLVVFCAKGSQDCKQVDAVAEDIAFFRAGRIKVLKLDIDVDPGLALLYAVHITPTLIALRSGQQVGRLEGVPKEQSELTQWIKQTLSI